MNKYSEFPTNNINIKEKKILLAHSNQGYAMDAWHERRRISAVEMGYNLSLFKMSDFHPYTIFPYLERKWKKRDPILMKFYEKLGEVIDECDIFIHYNGALIHPDFLAQFKDKTTIYHCADDPDASSVLSKPVAINYDICAISNPSCIEMYKTWGCENVFFWPIGSYLADDVTSTNFFSSRDIPLVFIGSKYGVSNVRFIGDFFGLYQKKYFFNELENKFPQLCAYGYGWKNGRIDQSYINGIYSNSKVGINIHNSIGPVNSRLYELSSYGICQICDNKNNLSSVFEEGKEIIGFNSRKECFDLIEYYLNNDKEAETIGYAARQRYLSDYTIKAIWENFFLKINEYFINI